MKNFAIFSNNNNYNKLLINIYELFSNQFNIKNNYIIYSNNNFYNKFMYIFYKDKLSNLDIDISLKKNFFIYCDLLSDDAYILKSINLIKKVSVNLLKGFNTNNLSIISDLKRIDFIKNNYIVLFLLKNKENFNDIIKIIVKYFNKIIIYYKDFDIYEKIDKNLLDSKINVNIHSFNNLFEYKFDLIINTIYENFNNKIFNILKKTVNFNTKYYDLFYYLNFNTELYNYCKTNKIINYSNGLGLLIYNAFYSFKLSNNVEPNLCDIFKKINLNI